MYPKRINKLIRRHHTVYFKFKDAFRKNRTFYRLKAATCHNGFFWIARDDSSNPFWEWETYSPKRDLIFFNAILHQDSTVKSAQISDYKIETKRS